MAKQRQTDININYKVNTVDVEKGNQLLNRASQSTDQLRNAAQNFGSVAGKSFQSASKHIEGMEIELARLRQQIKLTSTQDTARLAHLSNQYKSLKQQVDAYNKSLLETSKASKSAASDARSLATGFGDVYNTAKLLVSAGIAREIVNMALAAARLSGNVEGVEKAFARLPNSTLLLRSLREATHGTVTDLDLMQKALQAQNFRIPLESMGTLLEFAAVKAQQTGQEVNHLVDYIVSGIGYRSIKRLDDLGFTANRVRDALGGVSLQAASMQQVMTAVTTLMNEDLQKTGGYAETSATAVGQLETAWHDLSVEVSKQATSGGFIKFLNESVEAMRIFAKSGFDVKQMPVVMISEAITEMANAQAAAFEKSNKALKENERILDADNKIFQLAETIRLYELQGEQGLQAIAVLKQEIEALEDKNESIIGLQKLGTEESRQIQIKKQRIDQIIKENESLKMNKAVLSSVIQTIVDYSVALRQANDETEKEIELRDKILGRDTLSEKKRPAKEPFVQRVIDKQELVDIEKQIQDALNQVFIVLPVQVKPQATFEPDAWQKIGEEFAENWKTIVSSGIQNTADLVNSFVQQQADSYDIQLNQLRGFYDEQMNLAGDNERAKMELAIKRDREESKLRKKAFEADKEAKRLTTIINGAAGVINAFATLPYPAAVVASLLIAGQTAVQLAVISNSQYTGYKDGVIDLKGPGSKTSDSIPARLSKGESVMTADETSSSKGIFKAVRARKLNDKVLKDITSGRSGGSTGTSVDIGPIVKGLKDLKDSQPDIVQRSNLVYETRRKSDNYKQWVRSKSMNV